jgi:hypothetical protein
LFVFYFNGGYIIRISPIAKGILVVPLENVDEIAAGRKEVPNGNAYAMARNIQRVK